MGKRRSTFTSPEELFSRRVKLCLRAIQLLESSSHPEKEIYKIKRLMDRVGLVVIVEDKYNKVTGHLVTDIIIGDDIWHAHVQVDKETGSIFSRAYGVESRHPIIMGGVVSSPSLKDPGMNRRDRACVRRHRHQINRALDQSVRSHNAAVFR